MMINSECYAKNWNSNVCSHKCELFEECYKTWNKIILKKLKNEPINLSHEDIIKLLINTDNNYFQLYQAIKTKREHATPINLSENEAIMLIDYDF